MIARHNPEVFHTDTAFKKANTALSDSAIAIINDIASQVTSASYQRTPNFNMKSRDGKRDSSVNGFSRGNGHGSGFNSGGGGSNSHRGRKSAPAPVHDISEKEWEILRNFESTKMKAREGIDRSITNITGAMNKLTNETFDSILASVVLEINNINDTSDDTRGEMSQITNSIFELASNNMFYSELYARFTHHILVEFKAMKPVFRGKFDDTSKIIGDIQWCSPDDDYDQFCKNNKQNDKRRSLCSFYANLLTHEIITADDISATIALFQTELASGLNDKSMRGKNEEIAEAIFILVDNSKTAMIEHPAWTGIVSEIKQVAGLNMKTYPGVTNKLIFRFMDIIDSL